MEVEFTPSFFESLKKMSRRNTWWYRTYETITRNIPQFFLNIYRFRKVLWNHRWWDSHYTLEAMKTSIDIIATNIEEKGIEVDDSRFKKVEKMKRLIWIIDNLDEGVTLAEKELGYKTNLEYIFNGEEEPEEITKRERVLFNRATEIEIELWKEFCEIIKGQDYPYEQFDGTGLRGWWD